MKPLLLLVVLLITGCPEKRTQPTNADSKTATIDAGMDAALLGSLKTIARSPSTKPLLPAPRLRLGRARITRWIAGKRKHGLRPAGRAARDDRFARRIGRHIKRQRREAETCGAMGRQKLPDRFGRVTIDFILHKGMVLKSSVAHTSLRNPTTERCLVMAVRRWAMPRTLGDQVVEARYTFEFLPPESG